ncbi:unnamed protein product, partial [Brassica rapa]
MKGFMPNYKVWYLHGETTGYEYGSSSEPQTVDRLEESRTEVDYGVVSFLPYPRMRDSGINWLAVIKVTPRGRIISGEEPPLQEEQINEVEEPEQEIDDILLIDPHNHEYEDLTDDATGEAVEDEFNENDDIS